MSDLTGKFGAVTTQLATQHEEIMNALDTIATALGAPPPGPTTTLEDVVTALTTTNTLLTGIRSDMNGYLLDIFNTLDTINNNASLNAQRLYLLMLQNACPCDTEAPLLPLPIDTTPTENENTVQCQRIQYFIDMFVSWAINCGVYLDMHGNISSFQVKNLLEIVIGDISLPDCELSHMSISTRDNISTLLNTDDTPVAINSSIFDALTDSVVLAAMRQALYGATNASDGKDAIDAAIGSTVSSHANIIVAMFYSSWCNVIYSDSPVIDASAYDGELCLPESPCYIFTTADCISVLTEDGTSVIPDWTIYDIEIQSNPGHDNAVWIAGDWRGWSWTITDNAAGVYHVAGGFHAEDGTALTGTYGLGLDNPSLATFVSSDVFALEFCPPAE